MSMTIQTTIKGITDLELFISALKEMGKKVHEPKKHEQNSGGKSVLAVTTLDGHRVGISKNKKGEFALVGDSDWSIMNDKNFHRKLRQQYSVEVVKQKAAELRYSIASVDVQEDGTIKVLARAWG